MEKPKVEIVERGKKSKIFLVLSQAMQKYSKYLRN